MKIKILYTLAGALVVAVSAGAFIRMDFVPRAGAAEIQALEGTPQPAQQLRQAGMSTSLAPAPEFGGFGSSEGDRSFHSDIEYYEVILSYGAVEDPRPVFLMVNAYIVASQQEHGIRFFQKILKHYKNQMTGEMRATYLSAYALLRATYADEVFLPKRIGWVLDTFDILDEARAAAGDENPLVRWASGLIYAQVPWFFGKQEAALTNLSWLAEHPEKEPTPGFYREAYHFLAKIHTDRDEPELAAHYLKKSGYESYEPSALFMGWYVTTKDKGLLFAPTPWIEEIVPGRVFAVRGFGFSEIHFVVTDDGQQLISVDAGTQPFSMEDAYGFFMEHYPDSPPLTTALITHAHWDHIGGHTYLKSMNPDLKIYGRENYAGTVERVLRNHTYKQFRSASFSEDWVADYKPDIAVSVPTNITVGGTVFELIPAIGGETEDALLVNMPDLKVVFMGDALMPFYGEPWVEEGFVDEALETMDQVIARKPEHILHGHYGLTVMYGAQSLKPYRDAFAWLLKEVSIHLNNGYSIKDIVRLNLIPPGLEKHPEAFMSYLSPRDHIIARVADHMVGIWQEDVTGREPGGLDVITSIEYGRLLERYLGLSAGEVEDALRAMLDGGDNELALQLAVAAEARYQDEPGITRLMEEAADRLRGAAQYFDPFKFVVYTEMIGKEHRPVPARLPKP